MAKNLISLKSYFRKYVGTVKETVSKQPVALNVQLSVSLERMGLGDH